MSGWQPIESAPKDGTDVLLYDPEGTNVFEGVKVVGKKPYVQIGSYGDYGWVIVDEQCGGTVSANPTLWTPIPELRRQ